MSSSLINLLRGIWLLRDERMVRMLGRESLLQQELETLRRVSPTARISDSVRVFGYRCELFKAGIGVQVREGSVLAFGDETNGYGRIELGNRTWVGQYNNLRAGGGDIRIGNDCLISQFCSIVASNHAHVYGPPIQLQGVDPKCSGVTLGNDVWLGAGCAVMPGVAIGDGAILGANAVATRDIPANEIWGGIPARKIGIRQ